MPGAEVARPLCDDDEVGADDVPRGEQAGVHGDRLEVAAERLPGGDAGVDPARRRAGPATVRENQAGSAPPSVIT